MTERAINSKVVLFIRKNMQLNWCPFGWESRESGEFLDGGGLLLQASQEFLQLADGKGRVQVLKEKTVIIWFN